MRTAHIVNETRGVDLATRAKIADHFLSRLRGLLGRDCLEPGEGLVIEPCASVHGMFMNFALDVLFLGSHGEVLHAMRLGRWRFSPFVRGARRAVELPLGTIARTGTRGGDFVSVIAEDR